MDQQDEKSIEQKIKKIDEQIALLSDIRLQYHEKLNILRLNSQSVIIDTAVKKTLTPDEKVVLFKSYFRGRDDVYAKYWINKCKEKHGYSPSCKYEWVRSLCKKPHVKCSQCSNQEFNPLDEDAIYQHLAGKQIIGIYPMLQNENCYFIAFDFDKEQWFDDMKSLIATCGEEGIPAVMERSRSGKGGHVWIFFDEEVPAYLARRLGSYLITKTMRNRYQIDMKSYDRLFPNQDTLPKGGFGNLIALPFQKEAVRNGNSIFIDISGNPYPDQWAYLSSVRKSQYNDIKKITDEATRDGQIIDVRQNPVEENDEPWMRLPSGKKRFKIEMKDIPESIEIVLANRLYIKTDKVLSVLLNQLKHLAAFQNPEFYKKQKMRFSTHDTPRVICCAEIIDDYLTLPRGCLEDSEMLLKEYGVRMNLTDKRYFGKKVNFVFKGALNSEQKRALKGILSADFGVLVAPPGSGKTVLAISAIAKRKTNTLILTHRKPLMDQWRLQISSLLGIDKKDIGQIGGGKNKSNGKIDIAMVQSLHSKQEVDDRIADYGFVIVDECHHVSAFSFEKVLAQAKAKYVLGLTATPYRRDGHQPIIHMQCGPICHQIKQKDIFEHLSDSSVITRETNFSCEWNNNSKIHDVWSKIIADEQRNLLISKDVIDALDQGGYPLILTERREHLEKLFILLKDKTDFIAILYGGLGKKKTREIFEDLREKYANSRKVILATGSYIGEGFDEPKLDTLFITMPASFKGKIVQYAGRLHRFHKDKKNICIYDYVDSNVPVLAKMFKKRVKTYKMLGYSIG